MRIKSLVTQAIALMPLPVILAAVLTIANIDSGILTVEEALSSFAFSCILAFAVLSSLLAKHF